jgi:hypothetical protein
VQKWEARFAPKQIGVHRFSVIIDGKVQEQIELPVSANM